MIGAGPYRSRQSGASQASSARQPGVWRVRRHVEATGLATGLLRRPCEVARSVEQRTVTPRGAGSSPALAANGGRIDRVPVAESCSRTRLAHDTGRLPLLVRDRARGAVPRFTSAAKADSTAAQSDGGSDTHCALPQRPERIGRVAERHKGCRPEIRHGRIASGRGSRNARLAAWRDDTRTSRLGPAMRRPLGMGSSGGSGETAPDDQAIRGSGKQAAGHAMPGPVFAHGAAYERNREPKPGRDRPSLAFLLIGGEVAMTTRAIYRSTESAPGVMGRRVECM